MSSPLTSNNPGFHDMNNLNNILFPNESLPFNTNNHNEHSSLILKISTQYFFFHKKAVVNEDQNLNYYQEYCRLFIANVVLTTQVNFFLSY